MVAKPPAPEIPTIPPVTLAQPGYFKSPDRWRQNNRLARVVVTLSDGRQIATSFRDGMREQTIAIGGGPILFSSR